MRVHTLQPLTLVFRPWFTVGMAVGMGVLIVVAVVKESVRHGVGMDSTWGPLMGLGICGVVGAAAGRFWRVEFDRGAGLVRWRVRSVFGETRGEVAYGDVAGVALPAGRARTQGRRRRPRRGIALLRKGGEPLRLSWYAAGTPRELARLERMAGLIRAEVGIGEPGAMRSACEAILAAGSDVVAVRAAQELFGVRGRAARDLVGQIRGGGGWG